MFSEEIIKALIEMIPPIFATVFGGFISIKLFKMARDIKTVHTLVNSSYGVALRLNASNARWRADKEGKPEDIQAAEQAEKLLREHDAKQEKADNET